jgi:hypothetical protein
VLGGLGTMRRKPNPEMSHECRTGESRFTEPCEELAPIDPEGLGEEIRGGATIDAHYRKPEVAEYIRLSDQRYQEIIQ